MRSTLVLFLSVATVANAYPWARRCCCPPPVVVRLPDPRPVLKAVPEDVAPDGWCHIHGRVVFDGDKVPVPTEIPKSNGAYTEEWVVHPKNLGVKNVVVWLVPELSKEQLEALKGRKLREAPFKPDQVYSGFSQKGERAIVQAVDVRAFVPHVQVAQAGSNLALSNGSNEPHNVRFFSQANGEMNLLLAPGKAGRVQELKPERLPIAFDDAIHPWMRAYLWVFDHPYFAVADDDGRFEIKFAPKGNLRLAAWQEQTGFKGGRDGRWGEPIKVPNGKLDLGDIKLKPEK